MSSVTLSNISKTYPGGVQAIRGLSLEIRDGEFLVLVGPSGCGKTTTLRIVAGLESLADGELFIGERRVNDVPAKNRNLAMVFQNYALYPHMTVFENMAFSLEIRRTPKPQIKRRILEAAALLGIEDLLMRRPGELSGGQMQRVALGRAIVREPQVFLMDEPLSNLDAKLRSQMRAEIIRLHKSLGTTFIYVTHDQTEAMTMGTRIAVMNGGLLQQADTPESLYDHPANQFVAGFIGTPQMNFFPACLESSAGRLQCKAGETGIPLSDILRKRIEASGFCGRDVVLGIRPEDIHLNEHFIEEHPQNTTRAKIEMKEMMGAETFVHLDLFGKNAVARAGRFGAQSGETVQAAIDADNIHLFDPATQKSIFWGKDCQPVSRSMEQ